MTLPFDTQVSKKHNNKNDFSIKESELYLYGSFFEISNPEATWFLFLTHEYSFMFQISLGNFPIQGVQFSFQKSFQFLIPFLESQKLLLPG